ncbi:MAG: 1-deoxy-D-xylulose-5-phosphate synthase [Clostridia bacterium]|nr:1-deoxy-D-xylulose-5-phosphate synthase [Clostridia bacterium]
MRQYPLLEQIHTPADLKNLPAEALPTLCSEIREFLIAHVSRTGGHLASNLGAVELSVAVHRVFSAPADDILFDVGHQAYVHKILTGRRERFDTLRRLGGLSGFLRPSESEYDSAVSGHASSSVSVALGMARAKRLRGDDSATVCILGDGALTGGMAYEALNDAGQSGLPLIVVFNDNDMSISRNVGAIAKRLSAIRLKKRYFHMKERTKRSLSHLPGGKGVIRGISSVKSRLRTAILKETVFELMGFTYLGPADGHDISTVCNLLEEARRQNCPVVIHLKTVKGKGYLPSEQEPTAFHGVSAFDVATGRAEGAHRADFSAVFGETMERLAEKDGAVCAVTAAMAAGTGLEHYARRYNDRFFDVGIAEEHAVAMSAGLAARGMKPVCAVYSTFLQRAYDQMIHDVAIGGLHVVLAVDRAGLVGADGETHQGAFDVPYLRTVPGMKVYAPASYAELEAALQAAVEEETGPVAVRYPRGGEGRFTGDTMSDPCAVVREGCDLAICTYGILVNQALEAAERLEQAVVSLRVVKLNRLDLPDPAAVLQTLQGVRGLLVLEDCVEQGCLGQRLAQMLAETGESLPLRLLNLKDHFIPHGKVDELCSLFRIDAEAVFSAAKELARG